MVRRQRHTSRSGGGEQGFQVSLGFAGTLVEDVGVLEQPKFTKGRSVGPPDNEEKRVVSRIALVGEAVVDRPGRSRRVDRKERQWPFRRLFHGLVEVEDPCQDSIGWEVEPQTFRKDLEERTVEAIAIEESREMGQGPRASVPV